MYSLSSQLWTDWEIEPPTSYSSDHVVVFCSGTTLLNFELRHRVLELEKPVVSFSTLKLAQELVFESAPAPPTQCTALENLWHQLLSSTKVSSSGWLNIRFIVAWFHRFLFIIWATDFHASLIQSHATFVCSFFRCLISPDSMSILLFVNCYLLVNMWSCIIYLLLHLYRMWNH